MSKKIILLSLIMLYALFAFSVQLSTYDNNHYDKKIELKNATKAEPKAVLFMVDITSPAATVINPLPFEPEVWVMNTASETAVNYWIRLSIKDALTNQLKYRDSLLVVDSLYSTDDTTLAFPSFAPVYLTQYYAVAEVWMDTTTGIDTMFFSTYDADAMVSATYDPVSPQNYLTDYSPNADFSNNGIQTITFYAHCDIYENGQKAYSDSVLITDLASANTQGISFATFYAPHYPGASTVYFYTNMKHDVNRGNDTLSYDIKIIGPYWTNLDPATSTSTQWAGRCVDSEGKIYVVSGLNSSTLINLVQVYDTINGWSTLTSVPTMRFTPACAVIDSKLIVIDGGDMSFNAVHATEIYDLRTSTWGTGTLSPVAMIGAGGGVVNEKMYILGGAPNTAIFTGMYYAYEYDVRADTVGGTPWRTLSTYSPGHGTLLGSPFYGNPGETQYAYITGDYQGYHDFFQYEPAADTVGGTPWTTLTATPADVGGKDPSIVTKNGNVYVIGGDISGDWGGTYSAMAYQYDFENDEWDDIGFVLNQGVEGNVVGLIGDVLYAHGGTTGSSAINPAPFEKYRLLSGYGDVYAPYIVSTSPYNRQVNVSLDKIVKVAFSEPVDTFSWMDAIVNPDPGLLMMFFNETLDSLFIFHDDFKYNQTYYIDFDVFYDSLGYRSIVKSVPYTIGFATGPTGVNDKAGAYDFSLQSMNLIAKPNSNFDFMLYSPSKEKISIEIYSLMGNKIADLSLNEAKVGLNKVSWNLKNSNNEKVSSGIYFFKINNSKNSLNGKLIIAR